MARKNLYDSIPISVYFSLCLGLFPMYLTTTGKHKRRTVKTNKTCSYIIISYIVIFTALVIAASRVRNPIAEGKLYSFNTLARLIIFSVIYVNIAAVYVLHVLSYLYKGVITDVVNTMADVERSLAKYGHKFKYNWNFFINVGVCTFGLLFMISTMSLELWNIPREGLSYLPPILWMCHLYPFILIHHGESQFVLLNLLLYTRFQAINSLLAKMNQDGGANGNGLLLAVRGGTVDKRQNNLLDTCIRCHDILCDLCTTINKIYGFVLIAGCIIQFNTIAFAFCYCYFNINVHPVSTLGWFLWATLRIYEVFRKSVAAHINSKEAFTTLQHVNRLLKRPQSDLKEQKLEMFRLQILHRKFSFTAAGLFTVDGSLILTFISALTTYITIIYQFQFSKLKCD